MEAPTDVGGIQTFLGCVNYLLEFTPNFSHITEPLRRLTQVRKYEFAWQSKQQREFEHIILRYVYITKCCGERIRELSNKDILLAAQSSQQWYLEKFFNELL